MGFMGFAGFKNFQDGRAMNRTTTNRRARDCLLLSEPGFMGFRDYQDWGTCDEPHDYKQWFPSAVSKRRESEFPPTGIAVSGQ